jgi:aspartate aminotransferase
MTGWRIGYAGGPKSIISAMKKLQGQSTSNPCSISQAASVAALTSDQSCVREMNQAFRKRHDFIVKALNETPGFRCREGAGTFYAFPNVAEAIRKHGLHDDTALAELLLKKGDVAVVPGSAFGAPGYLRLSFACGIETLAEAVTRIRRVLS